MHFRTEIKSKPVKLALAGLMMAAGIASVTGFAGEAAAWRVARMDTSAMTADALPAMRPGAPVSYYTAVADTALATRPADYGLAEAATIRVLAATPTDAQAWNRLAFIDLRRNGRLTREGMAALYQSYQVSPYGDLSMMIWRVEFAAGIWPSLPDDLQAQTLRQIPVIGRFGNSWDWRRQVCRENQQRDIYQAVCAIAPGVVRPQD